MSVLSTARWQGEPIKLVINFNTNTHYTVYSDKYYDQSSQNFIKDIKFHISEGNNKVNPLGIAASNSINIQIYDENNNLNPSNTNSPYYGLMVNGIEIKAYISYDGSTWSDYGTFYTTSWSGGFSDGWHGLVSISAEDRLNTIGNKDMPNIPAFNEVLASNLIAYVFNAIGLQAAEYSIDSSIDRTLGFAVVKGNKVRDFINNVCQLLFARVIVDRQNTIRFVSALELYTGYNELTIGSEYTGSFSNKINNNIDYTKVKVIYLSGQGIKEGEIDRITGVDLSVGLNELSGIVFDKTVLAIGNIGVYFDKTDSNASIDGVSYQAYQNGITIQINVNGEAIENATIIIYGTILETIDGFIQMLAHPGTVGGQGIGIGGKTFEFETKQLMSSSDANTLCTALVNYINTIGNTFTIKGSALTPQLYTGDKLIIEDTDTIYDANYKIIELVIEFGENYNLDVTLLKI